MCNNLGNMTRKEGTTPKEVATSMPPQPPEEYNKRSILRELTTANKEKDNYGQPR